MERSKISREEALKLLYKNYNDINESNVIFDIYGNYKFPTEITTDTPNMAAGTTQIITTRIPEKV